MVELKICKVGEQTGIFLPEEVVQRLNIHEGDAVYLSERGDGSFCVTQPERATTIDHHWPAGATEALMRAEDA